MRKLLLSVLLIPSIVMAEITTSTDIKDSYFPVEYTYPINALHTINIKNNRNTEEKYRIILRICAENHNCSDREYRIKVAPKKVYVESGQSSLSVNYHRPGQKSIWAETIVDGESVGRSTKRATAFVS